MSYNSNSLTRQENDNQFRHEDAETEAFFAAFECEEWGAAFRSAVNDNPRPSPSPHGTLSEALAEIARAKAAKADAEARKRPAPAPGLVTAAEGKAVEVVIREEGPSPSPTPAPAPIKPWEDASEHERAIYINRALVTFGRPFAVSINFSPEIIEKALNDNRDPRNYLRRQVLRHVKRAIGARPMWIKVETTKLGKIHVHIGAALNDNDDPQEFERIAASSGGNHSCQGSKPADVRPMWFLDGWVSYCGKGDARTRRHLREILGLEPGARVPLYSATADIRAEGRRLYEEARQAAREARQRPIVVEVPQPAPAPAEPASDSQDAPAPASRFHDDLAAVVRAPLPVPAIVIRVAPIAPDVAWTMGTRKATTTRSSAPKPVRPQLGALAVQVMPIAAVSPPRRPAAARSRGPPGDPVVLRDRDPRCWSAALSLGQPDATGCRSIPRWGSFTLQCDPNNTTINSHCSIWNSI